MKIISTNSNEIQFDKQLMTENGLVVQYKKNEWNEIPFSDLDKIYIKVYQSKLKNISILFPVLLAFLFIEYAQLDITMFMALFPVFPFFLKINYFRRFAVLVQLKNGRQYRKNFPVKKKYKHIEFINAVKTGVQKNAGSNEKYQLSILPSEVSSLKKLNRAN
ncbi:hypothetical protein [Flavobacterium nackdongense]|uniref:Uncharacterized protein n=1 Tax=Flavobacterium nackdongense TaxID=2547394 RepID=A0A4P6YB98_9FLAO|nr:hypothetical protein [Flavobacterium nackdongense]QBN20441.1 hypothetical protein E1750_17135 [Flavobacterium nackdongense]